MKMQHRFTSILSTLLIAGFCSAPRLHAQQSNPATPQQSPGTAQQQPAGAQPSQTNQNPAASPAPADTQSATPAQNQSQQQPSPGTSVNPSQAPLQPVTTYPDAAGAQQEQQPTPAQTTAPEGPKPKPSEPVGAATAESVPTTGGAAAKPAGVAIAPAKQHQTRSLMLKIGAVVAAGAALGTVYALSHGTSSTPPGAGAAGVVPR